MAVGFMALFSDKRAHAIGFQLRGPGTGKDNACLGLACVLTKFTRCDNEPRTVAPVCANTPK